MTKPTAFNRAISFKILNRTLDALEMSASLMETARLLYPDMPPKFYERIYRLAHEITVRCPMNTDKMEL